jgi:hypothetical protein
VPDNRHEESNVTDYLRLPPGPDPPSIVNAVIDNPGISLAYKIKYNL